MEDLRIDLGRGSFIRLAYKGGQLTFRLIDRDMELEADAERDTNLGVVADWFKRAAAEAAKPKVDPVKVAHFSVGRGYATVVYDERQTTAGVALCAPSDKFLPSEGERIARERLAQPLSDEKWKKIYYSEHPKHVPAPERVRRTLEFMIDAHDAPPWAKGAEIAPHVPAAPLASAPIRDLRHDLDAIKYSVAPLFPQRPADGPRLVAWLAGGCASCGAPSRDGAAYVCARCFWNMVAAPGFTGTTGKWNALVSSCDAFAVGRVKQPAR